MAKGKKDKMTNRDQQYSTMAKGKKGQNDKQSFLSFCHCAVLLITVCLFCPFFPLAIVLYC
jgi:hypothetical protein